VPSMDIAASMDGATAANDRRARSPGVTKRRLAAGAEAPDCTGSRSTGGRELMAKLGAGERMGSAGDGSLRTAQRRRRLLLESREESISCRRDGAFDFLTKKPLGDGGRVDLRARPYMPI
jgi:hypothetical protein